MSLGVDTTDMAVSNDGPITASDPAEAVRVWFERLGEHCAAGEYEPAREIIADDVVSFGTKAELVKGRDTLQHNQWEQIWPYTEGFAFDFEQMHTDGEGDLGWGTAVWTSTGFDEEGGPFHRPGRTTVVIERDDGEWRATHTHFSLFPGTPQRTFGPEGAQESRGDE
jgi:ketosteroid isomerase-like protein